MNCSDAQTQALSDLLDSQHAAMINQLKELAAASDPEIEKLMENTPKSEELGRRGRFYKRGSVWYSRPPGCQDRF